MPRKPKKEDDVTSKKNATLASDVLSGKKIPTKKEILTLAAIALDNAANKKPKKK